MLALGLWEAEILEDFDGDPASSQIGSEASSNIVPALSSNIYPVYPAPRYILLYTHTTAGRSLSIMPDREP